MARGIERPMDNCDLPVVADSLEDRRVQAQDFRLASCERVLIRGPRRIGSVADPPEVGVLGIGFNLLFAVALYRLSIRRPAD